MALLKPVIAVMDETDSGLDIDALRVVSEGGERRRRSEMGVLVITHYNRILNYIKPHKVHVMKDGRIVTSGGPELRAGAGSAGLRLGARGSGGVGMSVEPGTDPAATTRRSTASTMRTSTSSRCARASTARRRGDLAHEGRAGVDDEYRLKALAIFEQKPMPDWAATWARSTSRTSTTTSSPRPGSDLVGGRARRHEAHVRQARDSRGRAEVPLGRRAQYDSEVVYHKIKESLEAQGVLFLSATTACAITKNCSGSTRHRDPVVGQQVRGAQQRGVSGGSFIYVPKACTSTCRCSLLPHQHARHGPVRAHADHRRRGRVRALR